MYVKVIHEVATAYGCRPSSIIGIPNDVVAFNFDAAVLYKYNKMENGEHTDPKVIRAKQTAGFNAIQSLRGRVASANRG